MKFFKALKIHMWISRFTQCTSSTGSLWPPSTPSASLLPLTSTTCTRASASQRSLRKALPRPRPR